MKLRILTVLAFLFAGFISNAQSLSISQTSIALDVDGHVNYGDVIVSNTTSSDLIVKVRQEPILTVADEKVQICWGGLCFNWQGGTHTYGTPAGIYGGDDYDGFAISFQPNSALSGSIWRVCFFVDGDPSDEVCIEVTFGTVGIEEASAPIAVMGDAKPNPAVSSTTIPYSNLSGTTSLLVRNIMGQKVHAVTLPSGEGQHKLDLTEFENGIYFYSLVSSGEVLFTKRLMVGQ